MNSSNSISIYTDGSCLGNPGPGGWAAIILQQQQPIAKISGHEYQTTNNRMEMQALISALDYIKANHISTTAKVFSDSNLLVQTINQGWKRKANLDLWQQLDQLLRHLSIEISWVKAHATNHYNNLADRLALKQAQKAEEMLRHNPRLSASASN